MAKTKSIIVRAIEYPILEPWDYLHAAVRAGYTQTQAQELSGIAQSTWMHWLYTKRTQGKPKKVILLERLHRVANDMGWL